MLELGQRDSLKFHSANVCSFPIKWTRCTDMVAISWLLPAEAARKLNHRVENSSVVLCDYSRSSSSSEGWRLPMELTVCLRHGWQADPILNNVVLFEEVLFKVGHGREAVGGWGVNRKHEVLLGPPPVSSSFPWGHLITHGSIYWYKVC